jgi:glycosyltransferase involved in cell wall biosynthesis
MRILFTAAIDVNQWNAAPIHFFSIINAFACKNNVICHAFFPKANDSAKIKEFVAGNVNLHPQLNLKKYGVPNFVMGVLLIPLLLFTIWKHRIEYVYVRMHLMSFLTHFFIKVFTRAKTISEHNGWMADEIHGKQNKFSHWLISKFQLWDAKWANRVRVVVSGLKRFLEPGGIPAKKIFVAGNGTNTSKFMPIDRAEAFRHYSFSPKKTYLGFIGNLAYWQGVHIAIEAMMRLKQEFANIRLLIAGDGPKGAELKQLAQDLNLENEVIFLGAVDGDEAKVVINLFDIAIFPATLARNDKIGLSPLKIRDYAATGRPVLAADIEGIKEHASTNWLITHTPDDVDDFCNKARVLIENPDMRTEMGRAARRYAEAYFDWSHVGDIIYREFEKIG